jgi:hypothetical protein
MGISRCDDLLVFDYRLVNRIDVRNGQGPSVLNEFEATVKGILMISKHGDNACGFLGMSVSNYVFLIPF